MAVIKNSNTEVLVAPAAIFNAEVKTKEVMLDNFQAAHFVVATGAGTGTTVKAQIVMTNATGEEKVQVEKEIIIGQNHTTKIVGVAAKLAHDGFDRVYLKIENAQEADMLGAVMVVLTNDRYSQE